MSYLYAELLAQLLTYTLTIMFISAILTPPLPQPQVHVAVLACQCPRKCAEIGGEDEDKEEQEGREYVCCKEDGKCN